MKKNQEAHYLQVSQMCCGRIIRFQTPFPARMRVFYEGETCLYNSAEEATKDMVKRGLSVPIYKPPASCADRVENLMWSKIRSARGEQEVQPETLTKCIVMYCHVFLGLVTPDL